MFIGFIAAIVLLIALPSARDASRVVAPEEIFFTCRLRTTLLVAGIGTIFFPVAFPPNRHTLPVSAGKHSLRVTLSDGARILIATIPTIIIPVAFPHSRDAFLPRTFEFVGWTLERLGFIYPGHHRRWQKC